MKLMYILYAAATLVLLPTPTHVSGMQMGVCASPCTCSSHLRIVDCSDRHVLLDGDRLPRFPNTATQLFLNHSGLHDIHQAPFRNLVKLRALYLNDNGLESHSLDNSSFTGLTQLQVLDMSTNDFDLFPSTCFSHLRSLQRLYLDVNPLPSSGLALGAFTGLTQLRLLSLEDTHLTTLTSAFMALFPELRVLLLSGADAIVFKANVLKFNVHLRTITVARSFLSNDSLCQIHSLDKAGRLRAMVYEPPHLKVISEWNRTCRGQPVSCTPFKCVCNATYSFNGSACTPDAIDPANSSAKSSEAIIAGASVGGLLFAIAIVLLYNQRRRRPGVEKGSASATGRTSKVQPVLSQVRSLHQGVAVNSSYKQLAAIELDADSNGDEQRGQCKKFIDDADGVYGEIPSPGAVQDGNVYEPSPAPPPCRTATMKTSTGSHSCTRTTSGNLYASHPAQPCDGGAAESLKCAGDALYTMTGNQQQLSRTASGTVAASANIYGEVQGLDADCCDGGRSRCQKVAEVGGGDDLYGVITDIGPDCCGGGGGAGGENSNVYQESPACQANSMDRLDSNVYQESPACQANPMDRLDSPCNIYQPLGGGSETAGPASRPNSSTCNFYQDTTGCVAEAQPGAGNSAGGSGEVENDERCRLYSVPVATRSKTVAFDRKTTTELDVENASTVYSVPKSLRAKSRGGGAGAGGLFTRAGLCGDGQHTVTRADTTDTTDTLFLDSGHGGSNGSRDDDACSVVSEVVVVPASTATTDHPTGSDNSMV